MATQLITVNGVEHAVRFRRVPGYYNGSTYHVDVDGQHLMTVRRTSDATWSRSAVWSVYRPGVDWSESYLTSNEQRSALFLLADRSREAAVREAVRRLQRVGGGDA